MLVSLMTTAETIVWAIALVAVLKLLAYDGPRQRARLSNGSIYHYVRQERVPGSRMSHQ